jgi:hypothetical protein
MLYRVPLTYSLCFLVFLTSVLSRLLFNGMIFDFDYYLYQPDGAVYSYMAMKYAGLSHVEAAQRVIDWYAVNAEPGTQLSFSFFSPETNPGVWSLGSTRVLYPFISAPLVHFLGMPGMLVVPILSMLLFLTIIMRLAHHVNQLFLGSVLIFLLTLSPTMTRWFVANITDGLLAAIVGSALYLALILEKKLVWIPLVVLVTLGSITRFSAPYWIALAIIYWFLHKKTSIILFITSILGVLPTLLARPDSNSIVVGAGDSLGEKIVYFPLSALRVLFIEFAQLAAIDRSLLAILVAAILLSLISLRRQSSQLFLLMGLAGWFIGALNGVLGVNFRYQLPIIVFACWVILDQAEIFRNRPVGNILQIVGDKPKKKLNSRQEEDGK